MITEMDKMFEEKLQSLEKANSLLKEQSTKREKTKNARDEETQIGKIKKG